ncbi:hypothetical protein KRMM14A1259_18130 [Krasilnikovia sp. MM14-A1259]
MGDGRRRRTVCRGHGFECRTAFPIEYTAAIDIREFGSDLVAELTGTVDYIQSR